MGRGLLDGKRVLIAGDDSGIGRAVAVAFAKEGADVAIAFPEEDDDAALTWARVEKAGRHCVLLRGDLAHPEHRRVVVAHTVEARGGREAPVNHVAYQQPNETSPISDEQWRRTFAVNIDSFFHVTKAALAHLPDGAAIINTSSINGLRGKNTLMDYAATKCGCPVPEPIP